MNLNLNQARSVNPAGSAGAAMDRKVGSPIGSRIARLQELSNELKKLNEELGDRLQFVCAPPEQKADEAYDTSGIGSALEERLLSIELVIFAECTRIRSILEGLRL